MLAHLLLQAAAVAGALAGGSPWRALVVAGGPDAEQNQAAIESNVRYFGEILDPAIPHRVLFADGRYDTASVSFLVPSGRRVRFRPPRLWRIDGPTTEAGLAWAWRSFVEQRPQDPLLLYFTGHGIRNRRGDLDDNVFQLWGGGGISVRELARRIETLPEQTPVVLVMAQCFSGSFANVLFEGGEPGADAVERNLAGFFAATRDRPATGCTPEINEADYRDFSSYFFAALVGRTRTGAPVSGADFDRNGWVGMNEAFAWALVHQATDDVPVSTSDAFVRRYVSQPDRVTMDTPYSAILSWATPAERAALEGMSKRLGLSGEDRLRRAYEAQFGPRRARHEDESTRAYRLRFIRAAKTVVLAHVLETDGSPDLIERWRRLRALEATNPLRRLGDLPPPAPPRTRPPPLPDRAPDDPPRAPRRVAVFPAR